MTPEPSFEVSDIESTPRYQQQSQSQTHHHFDPDKKESPQAINSCKYCLKNGHSTSSCFQTQTNHSRKTNLESRKRTTTT